MMQHEYEDEYFLEEDKIKSDTLKTTSPNTVANKGDTFDFDPNFFLPIGADADIHEPHLRKHVNDATQQEADEQLFSTNDDLPDPILYASLVVRNERPGDETTDDTFDGSMNLSCQRQELHRLGMTVTSGTVLIQKDQTNLIGISIGGGAPYCPCLYIVQVFDGTPAAREGTLQSGDELLGVNGVSCKGKTKVAVAKMIQATDAAVQIAYNKLHADPVQGETLDIALKKIKHRLVEGMSTSTADSLGLSRAILCNDSLVKRLQELQGTESMYRGLVEHAKRMLKAYFDVLQTYQAFGNCFAALSVREPQPRASEAFRLFGEMHRNLDRDGVKMLKALKPVLADLGTYLTKAIPDTKLTIRRYADAKFAYLSYCLKVKEMDDEEHGYASMQEPTYRVETGNYEYRLVLRCRQEARAKFAGLRSDVLEKMELLESKHARDLTGQLRRFVQGLAQLGSEAIARLHQHPHLFPVEVDLKDSAFQYKSTARLQSGAALREQQVTQSAAAGSGDDRQLVEGCEEMAQEIREIPVRSAGDEVAKLIATWDSGLGDGDTMGTASGTAAEASAATGSADLLVELGLDDIDLSIGCTFDRQGADNLLGSVSLLD